jgi:serine/threonine protein kinase
MKFEDFKKEDLKIIKQIGYGQFSNVYEAEYQGNKYAIKKISKNSLEKGEDDMNEYMKNALARELNILKKMSELENSVKLYYNYEDEENYILILELCDTDLSRLLQEKKTFTSGEILSIMEGLNKSFKYMNDNNLVHRDIKPENILIKYIDSSKTKFIPKLSDYFASRELEAGRANSVIGTPDFMSPEVSEGQNYDNKCDLYSIGVMMYNLYFGSFPFERSKSKIEKDKPKSKDCEDKVLDDLLNKLLVYDPEKRISWDEYFKHPFFNSKNENN